MARTALCLLACLALATPARAQHESHGGGTPEALGTVHFATSCAPAVLQPFDRAVALLHSFEFRSAIDGFRSVLKADPGCAIAHWGIALSYWGNPFAGARTADALAQGRAAVIAGRSLGSPTPRERAFLDAVGALYEEFETRPQRDRVLAYERAMRALRESQPRDTEATIFYALALTQTALPTDKTYDAQLRAGAILEPLFREQPQHPGLAHYIIHAYDHPPLAPKALDAARRYASIAPSAPHALHMPSHTFTRVGAWRDSAATNQASERSALEQNVMGEALHAMDYQVYAYLQMAQDGAARAVVERLPGVVAKFDPAAIGGAAPGTAGQFAISAIPARFALERGAWADAARLDVPTTGTPYTMAMTHFARALGAARQKDGAAAASDVERLAALRDRLREMKDDYWSQQVDIQHRVASAWVAYAEGRVDEAVTAMTAAADMEDATDKAAVTPGPLAPARELLGDLLLELGRPAEARAAYEATMAKEPGRFRGLYGAARAAEVAGDGARSRELYRQLLDLARDADGTRPEVARARDAAAGR